MKSLLIVIPARGGSKGIPRKNLRPLAGMPLIYYSIKASLKVPGARVVVTTEDDEISLFSERFGADVICRPQELSADDITLDPVICHAVLECEARFAESYKAIVTVQPTSPLIKSGDIARALGVLEQTQCNTVLSVVDDRHLTWTVVGDRAEPLYKDRVNRQALPLVFKETGSVVACTREQIAKGGRIGSDVQICEVSHESSFDIDNYSDFYLCEAMLRRKKIVITVVGYDEVGLGHAYRGLLLAHELVSFEVIFVCESRSDLAIEYIRSNNYSVVVAESGKLLEKVIAESPNLVINDILDTSERYMRELKEKVPAVVNFEDLGPGGEFADLVVNALYPNDQTKGNRLVGDQYFCLRDEFVYLGNKDRPLSEEVKRILLAFGGVDEGDLTGRTLREIAGYCIDKGIGIDVIVGPGYKNLEKLRAFAKTLYGLDCNIVAKTRRISDFMINADIAITSAGRTVLELAAVSRPMVVVCQNQRETTHTFASEENGVLNLGYRGSVEDGKILSSVELLCGSKQLREDFVSRMRRKDFTKGKDRVIKAIVDLV